MSRYPSESEFDLSYASGSGSGGNPFSTFNPESSQHSSQFGSEAPRGSSATSSVRKPKYKQGARSVSKLSAEALERKRASDRNAQRVMRANTQARLAQAAQFKSLYESESNKSAMLAEENEQLRRQLAFANSQIEELESLRGSSIGSSSCPVSEAGAGWSSNPLTSLHSPMMGNYPDYSRESTAQGFTSNSANREIGFGQYPHQNLNLQMTALTVTAPSAWPQHQQRAENDSSSSPNPIESLTWDPARDYPIASSATNSYRHHPERR